jgi:hypothetical protein
MEKADRVERAEIRIELIENDFSPMIGNEDT